MLITQAPHSQKRSYGPTLHAQYAKWAAREGTMGGDMNSASSSDRPIGPNEEWGSSCHNAKVSNVGLNATLTVTLIVTLN